MTVTVTGELLLDLASTVILVSGSRGARDYMLFSRNSGSRASRLLSQSPDYQSQRVSQSPSHGQSYFTTVCLLPISSSWRQAP
jgi:hypothetical protein